MAYNPALYFPQPYQAPQFPVYQPQGRMAEIIPMDSVEAGEAFSTPIGTTTVMIGKDDSFMAIKVNGVNGQSSYTVFDRRPPAPPAPVFDPTLYVTREELEQRLNGLASGNKKEAKA